MNITLNFKLEKETKGAVRYEENPKRDDYAVGTLYIRKSALTEPYPQHLTVTIKEG